jgi:hypothetical protein
MDAERLTTEKHSSHIFERSDNTRVVFVWAPYSFRAFLSNSTTIQHIGHSFQHVFVNSGAWDMLFNDTDPQDYVDRLHSDLAALRLHYPKASMTVMNIHTMHPADRDAMGKKADMVTHCFAKDRQLAYRAMNNCAVKGIRGLELWDNVVLTNTSYARKYVMKDGHHYEPNINFMMLRVMASRVCSRTHIPAAFGPPRMTESCDVPPMNRHGVLCRTLRWHPPIISLKVLSSFSIGNRTYVQVKIKLKVRRYFGRNNTIKRGKSWRA